ncbi:transcription repressor OFP13-like [Curcuma longa]|uniref:transcription repressor OFP13-like n=1 Tax=Curcuma longa TaxID=136217 RepID=UPI003D9EFFD4
MERLKSSFKSLRGAVAGVRTIGPICVQEANTESFRGDVDLCSTSGSARFSFNLPHGSPPPREEDDSTAPSSSSSTAGHDKHSESDDLLLLGPISSERFFFSPCTSKSIAEDQSSKLDNGAEPSRTAVLCETVALSSEDPYRDFLASMEEVVAAHELREWRCLQELLHCYLRLNERKNHKVIVLAFVDLLMRLMEQDKLRKSRLEDYLPSRS